MIRKMLAFAGIVAGGLSFAMLVGKYETPLLFWALGSFSPYILLAAVFIYFKRGFFQSLLTPFLLFYGISGISNIPWEIDYIFGLVSALVMILMAGYILFRQLLRLRIFQTVSALIFGIILFVAVYFFKYHIIEDQMNIKVVQQAERNLFFQ